MYFVFVELDVFKFRESSNYLSSFLVMGSKWVNNFFGRCSVVISRYETRSMFLCIIDERIAFVCDTRSFRQNFVRLATRAIWTTKEDLYRVFTFKLNFVRTITKLFVSLYDNSSSKKIISSEMIK